MKSRVGVGQVVIVLAIYSDNQSSNPGEAYNFSVHFVPENNENTEKEAGLAHF